MSFRREKLLRTSFICEALTTGGLFIVGWDESESLRFYHPT